MAVPITPEVLQTIKDMVKKLSDDTDDANVKTQLSNDADTAAKLADAKAAQAKLDEAVADALVSTDLTDLTHYLDSLVTTP